MCTYHTTTTSYKQWCIQKSVLKEKIRETEIRQITGQPGDVLFFDGKMIHGSYRNATTDRWRRSFICHYIGENSQSFVASQDKHVSHLKA